MIWPVLGAVKTEYLKSKQLDLTEKVKEKILQEGLYHITSKENAEKIIESGYMLPSKGVLNNHASKSRYGDNFADFVYMFAGKPTKELFSANLSHIAFKDGTFYAIKHTPNKFDINNYTERLEDGAIMYEGRLDIANSNPELVRMKFEKGNIVEIPWNEEINTNLFEKIKNTFAVRNIKSLVSTAKDINKNAIYRDKEGKLKNCIIRKREERKMLQQYNNENNEFNYEINKNGKVYNVRMMGAKISDGRTLIGFKVSQEETGLLKNVFMDSIDLTEIKAEQLESFLGEHINEDSIRSEYIGKPIVDDGKIVQLLDEEYSHHFYNKQLMMVKNNNTYERYVNSEKIKKQSQLGTLNRIFTNTTANFRKEATQFIKKVKEHGIKNCKEFITQENTGFDTLDR